MPIAAIVSGKGGVTKTTTTYALAAALVKLGEEPVMVDLDPGASLTENAGLIADGTHALDLLNGQPIEGLTSVTNDGIPMVPGTPEMLNTSVAYEDLIQYAANLRRAAEGHLLIIDTAQGLALGATRAAILAADFLIVPMQAEPAIVRRSYPEVLALLRLFRRDERLCASFPIDPQLFFVMTKFNAKLKLSEQQLGQIAKDGIQIAAYVPTSVTAAEAYLVGKSVVTYAPKSPVSVGYGNLAHTLVASLNRPKAS